MYLQSKNMLKNKKHKMENYSTLPENEKNKSK
jgi:hypothetical protein